jgi:hypothetical protein
MGNDLAMTEQTNMPGPSDPPAPQAMDSGPLGSSDAQLLQDGGALEGGDEQWGPTRPPKTDAADDSAAEQTGEGREEDAPLAAGSPDTDRTSSSEPYISSAGRTSSTDGSTDGSFGRSSPGLPGSGASDSSAGRGDAGKAP